MTKPLKKGKQQNVAKKKRFMKKTKILTVLAVLLAMGMTACGKKTSSSVVPSSEEPAVSSSSEEPAQSSSSSVHEHSWDQGTVTTQPTCTEKGVKTYHCSGCNETKTEEVPALGHDWQEGTVTTQPTCTQKGINALINHHIWFYQIS